MIMTPSLRSLHPIVKVNQYLSHQTRDAQKRVPTASHLEIYNQWCKSSIWARHALPFKNALTHLGDMCETI